VNWEAIAATDHTGRFAALLACPSSDRDVDWLRAALQAAVAVEFSTVPPYLCALWSIKDDRHPAAASIRNVVQEEMLHLSLACNMLSAIGGAPQIASAAVAPRYWEHLPAGIHPDLVVKLGGFTSAAVDGFIEIESPDSTAGSETATGNDPGRRSIGDFYSAVAECLAVVRPEITIEGQVAGPLAHMTIPTVEVALEAISLIKDQGEGSSSPLVAHTDELAHYYRFIELKHRRAISHLDAAGAPVFRGTTWDEPETFPVAVVPDGGYQQPDVSADVWAQLARFDRTYTNLLDSLQLAWELGRETSFVRAIETMFELTTLGRSIMQLERPDGSGNYCPCFRPLR
jgi:hypothetical protein